MYTPPHPRETTGGILGGQNPSQRNVMNVEKSIILGGRLGGRDGGRMGGKEGGREGFFFIYIA